MSVERDCADVIVSDLTGKGGDAVASTVRSASALFKGVDLGSIPGVEDLAKHADEVTGRLRTRAAAAAVRGVTRVYGALVGDAPESVTEATRGIAARVFDQIADTSVDEMVRRGSGLLVRAVTSSEAARDLAVDAAERREVDIDVWPALEPALAKLLKPVPWVAKGAPYLNAIPLGPVPLGAVVVALVLAWSVAVTGDTLDSPRYPTFIAGMSTPR